MWKILFENKAFSKSAENASKVLLYLRSDSNNRSKVYKNVANPVCQTKFADNFGHYLTRL